MSFNKLYEELEKTGLMDRRLALGKEADDELSILEGKPKKPGVKKICLYCGELSTDTEFQYLHNCAKPTVIEEKEWECPSRPKKVVCFEILYNRKTYKFYDYESAMLFRRLVWLDEVPLCNALENKDLRWFR